MCVTLHGHIVCKRSRNYYNLMGIRLRNCHEARSEPVLLVYCISWCILLFVVESGMCLLATRLQGGKNHYMFQISSSPLYPLNLYSSPTIGINPSRFTSG